MLRVALATLTAVILGAADVSAQAVQPVAIDSAVSINRFVGENAASQPDIVIDVTAAVRLGKGWVGFVRPWFRRASSEPHDVAKEIYQAALQYQHNGPISTRVDLGYILSPIGLGMLDMRPDTNPLIMTHLSYVVPMPAFDPGVPSALPIASSYPLGGQVTVSTTKWDARAAVVTAPPNRNFVLYAASPNPRSRPTVVVGGGVTPMPGLRVGAGFAAGNYALASEVTRAPFRDRPLRMLSLEGEYAFGYTKVSGEVTHDALDTATGQARATQWFLQGMHALNARWFVAARKEGVNAPARAGTTVGATLRTTEAAVGYRLNEDFTIRGSAAARKTYFNTRSSRQAGVSLVWARRWW